MSYLWLLIFIIPAALAVVVFGREAPAPRMPRPATRPAAPEGTVPDTPPSGAVPAMPMAPRGRHHATPPLDVHFDVLDRPYVPRNGVNHGTQPGRQPERAS